MKFRLFKDISVGCEFFANGNLWVKESSRTATPSAYPTRVFYFKGDETVTDKGGLQMKTVMIDHPDHGSDYLAARYRPLAWQVAGLQKTASGYGTKLPTCYAVRYQGKERRIYADCYSNVAATYIIVNGQKVYVR